MRFGRLALDIEPAQLGWDADDPKIRYAIRLLDEFAQG
jgi:hypothetical protein